MSAGTVCSTVRSVSRAISSFGRPSIWPHMEPDASSTMMARSAAEAPVAIMSRVKSRASQTAANFMIGLRFDAARQKLEEASAVDKQDRHRGQVQAQRRKSRTLPS